MSNAHCAGVLKTRSPLVRLRSLDFTVRCRDVSDGRLGGHSGEAVVECDVERWGSEALYTS